MDLPSPPFTVASLCCGNGTADIALQLAVPNARTVLCLEREAHAIASLVRAMEAGVLAPAPVWTDVRTFDGRPWRGRIHCLIATYPCQPFSAAGKRPGEADPRHLWPDIARIIDDAKPAMVFLENVRGHLRLGFQRVCEDLREMGYETRAGLFSAEEMGMPHGRIRLFALAVSRRSGRWGASGTLGNTRSARRDGSTGTGIRTDRWPPQTPRSGEACVEHATGDDGTLHSRQRDERIGTPYHGGAGSFVRPFLFPPYRTGDWERWAEVLVSHPWLRPSLSQAEAEHLLLGMADGMARQLEFSRERVDRIGAVGLGIAPVSLAMAFVLLACDSGIADWTGTELVFRDGVLNE